MECKYTEVWLKKTVHVFWEMWSLNAFFCKSVFLCVPELCLHLLVLAMLPSSFRKRGEVHSFTLGLIKFQTLKNIFLLISCSWREQKLLRPVYHNGDAVTVPIEFTSSVLGLRLKSQTHDIPWKTAVQMRTFSQTFIVSVAGRGWM